MPRSSPFYVKMIILPRQARDKRRENSKKDAFTYTTAGGGRRRVQTQHIAQQQEASDKELRQAALNGDLPCVSFRFVSFRFVSFRFVSLPFECTNRPFLDRPHHLICSCMVVDARVGLCVSARQKAARTDRDGRRCRRTRRRWPGTSLLQTTFFQ
jgi:hypothetical protein